MTVGASFAERPATCPVAEAEEASATPATRPPATLQARHGDGDADDGDTGGHGAAPDGAEEEGGAADRESVEPPALHRSSPSVGLDALMTSAAAVDAPGVGEDEEELPYIPFDYESEMEACEQYVFSETPFTLSASAKRLAESRLVAARHGDYDSLLRGKRSSEMEWHGCSAARRGNTSPYHRRVYEEDIAYTYAWVERQRRDNRSYHADRHRTWSKRNEASAYLSTEHMQHSLRSLLREACCREMRHLHSLPAAAFLEMPPPLCRRHTLQSLHGFCHLSAATTAAEKKERYLQIVRGQWRQLKEKVEAAIRRSERESLATRCDSLRVISAELNCLSLFSSNPANIVRELDVSYAEEQRRLRREREARVLAVLEAQGSLFLLPTLYAEEEQLPTPSVVSTASGSSRRSFEGPPGAGAAASLALAERVWCCMDTMQQLHQHCDALDGPPADGEPDDGDSNAVSPSFSGSGASYNDENSTYSIGDDALSAFQLLNTRSPCLLPPLQVMDEALPLTAATAMTPTPRAAPPLHPFLDLLQRPSPDEKRPHRRFISTSDGERVEPVLCAPSLGIDQSPGRVTSGLNDVNYPPLCFSCSSDEGASLAAVMDAQRSGDVDDDDGGVDLMASPCTDREECCSHQEAARRCTAASPKTVELNVLATAAVAAAGGTDAVRHRSWKESFMDRLPCPQRAGGRATSGIACFLFDSRPRPCRRKQVAKGGL